MVPDIVLLSHTAALFLLHHQVRRQIPRIKENRYTAPVHPYIS
ncbi:hypothetical protein MY9_3563 [Bacillus sp. JS]|nr:hypothetical protein MY9_3563 [Bacillus sp. JS]